MHRLIYFVLFFLLGGCATNDPSPQSLNWSGNEAYFQKDYDAAIEWYTASLVESRKLGDRQFEAIAMYGLGRSNGHLCKLQEAEEWLIESIKIRRDLPDFETAHLTQNILELGRLHMAQGEWKQANEQFTEALPILGRLNMEAIDPLGYANLLEEYQLVLLNTGQEGAALANQAKIDEFREQIHADSAQYVSDLYPTNCTLNKHSLSGRPYRPPQL